MNDNDIKLPPLPRLKVPLIEADVDLLDIKVLAQWCERTATAYARASVAHATAALQAERDALARENEAMKRCAIRYLEWLGVTHMPLDQALYDDMRNPDMCGDAALAAYRKGGEQ